MISRQINSAKTEREAGQGYCHASHINSSPIDRTIACINPVKDLLDRCAQQNLNTNTEHKSLQHTATRFSVLTQDDE